jgi:hypothetical protein
VVAGNDRHVLRRPQALEPGERVDALLRQADVDEIAGDGDVVGPLRPEVGDDAVEHQPLIHRPAVAHPVGVAQRALKVPIARAEAGDRPQVDIGQVRDGKGCRHRSVGALQVCLRSSGFVRACQIA